MPLDLALISSQFPALQLPAIFFDNPGGTQVAQPVIDRMNAYLVDPNANHGGAFETSRAWWRWGLPPMPRVRSTRSPTTCDPFTDQGCFTKAGGSRDEGQLAVQILV